MGENKRNEISRSSAYIIDNSSSNRSSYSSYGGDSRTSRSTYRDRSLDFSARASHRSASRDLGSVKLRTRDHSTDISNGYRRDYSSGYTTSKASKYENEERSEEYKKIMANTDKYLTMSKYSATDKQTTEMNNMMEEERRSKAYSKIIGAPSAQSSEADNNRATLTDIFCNTSGFSAKTVQAIYKETLYKEDGGRPKNYGWRKDMEAYEDNLEKINEHKKAVRDTTKATREVNYKDTNAKIRDYERESRRNVDTDSPVIRKVADTGKSAPASTYSPPSTTSYRASAVVEDYEPDTKPVRGNWRKVMEKLEQKLEKKKTEPATPRATTVNASYSRSVAETETSSSSSTSWREKFKKFGDNSNASSTSSSVQKTEAGPYKNEGRCCYTCHGLCSSSDCQDYD